MDNIEVKLHESLLLLFLDSQWMSM